MREPYGEGLATHTDPESCVGVREGVGEALTGAHAGWVSSRERPCIRGVDLVGQWGRQHGRVRHGEHPRRPCVVVDPMHAHGHVWKLLARKPGDLPAGHGVLRDRHGEGLEGRSR